MAYSRWSHSMWYTYWNASSGKDIEEQVLTVCGTGPGGISSINYVYAKEDLDAVVNHVIKQHEGETPGIVTQKERDELKGYIKEWTEDVEYSFSNGLAKATKCMNDRYNE